MGHWLSLTGAINDADTGGARTNGQSSPDASLSHLTD